jgi:hypothetical protein
MKTGPQYRRRIRRIIVYAVATMLIAAAALPVVSADRYREPIEAALENALGRKVEIGRVRIHLLPQPGFTLTDVTIGEDPAVGAEPAAYVTTLRAVPGISTLLGGPLRFSSMDLEEASLNLTRVERGENDVHWDFSSLLQPRLLAAFPSVHLRNGRINFKFNDTKSIFYLLDTDVDLWPPDTPRGSWTLRVRGKPARTDRPARGFGSFLARGEWHQRDSSVTLDVKLEQSELGDMLTLFKGYDSGLQGAISGDAHLAGPLDRVGISGQVKLSNLHAWNQTPPGGNAWPFLIGGAVNAPGQTVDLYAKMAGAQPPLVLRYRVADYLRRPRWGVTASVNKFSLSPLPALARNLGWPIPADFKFDGTADGAVSYSMPEGSLRMDGAVNLANATLTAPGTPPLRFPNAGLRFSGTTVRLLPAAITNEGAAPSDADTATLEAAWDSATQKFDASLSTSGMAIAALRRQISVAGMPLLGLAMAGTWRGILRYTNEPAGWSGEIHLRDADVPFEAFAEPLHIRGADVSIGGAGVAMKRVELSAAGMEANGEYRYDPSSARPHKFRIAVPVANGPAIEKLFMPALRRGNFLTYAFNFGRVPEPGWLRNMRADGAIEADTVELGGNEFSNLRARVVWDGAEVRLRDLETQLGEAAFAGAATINLADRQPAYRFEGKVTAMPWRSGSVDAEGTLTTSGIGSDLFSRLRAQGTFQGRELDLAPLDAWDSVAGAFDLGWDGHNPKLRLDQLVMKTGADTWIGSAETQSDGQLLLRISDGGKQIQAAGAILRGEALKPVAP